MFFGIRIPIFISKIIFASRRPPGAYLEAAKRNIFKHL
jgi:hypothetical protein